MNTTKSLLTFAMVSMFSLTSQLQASQVDKIRVYCESKGKYNGLFIGPHRVLCRTIFTYNFETKHVDGSFSCVDNQNLLLINGEIKNDNSTIIIDEVVKVNEKNTATITRKVPKLIYRDRYFNLSSELKPADNGYKVKESDIAIVTLNNVSLKTNCSALEGTRDN